MASAKVPAPRQTGWPLPVAVGPDLLEVEDFGSNPGRLRMLVHLPVKPPGSDAPLIVLLHGCGQGARGFAAQAGWITLSDRLGIPLVMPAQSEDNNRGRCFNWFRPLHASRGHGEAQSIHQMVATAIQRFGSNSGRVFIAGLSAGGAMAAALLASYPEVFAAGAVCAGLPVGAASSVSEALRRMADAGPARSPSAWADQARRAAPVGYRDRWPRLSVWHGAADQVVDPENGRLLAIQWTGLHGTGPAPTHTQQLGNTRHDQWLVRDEQVVELWSLGRLKHDWPPEAVEHIARFWDLAAD